MLVEEAVKLTLFTEKTNLDHVSDSVHHCKYFKSCSLFQDPRNHIHYVKYK